MSPTLQSMTPLFSGIVQSLIGIVMHISTITIVLKKIFQNVQRHMLRRNSHNIQPKQYLKLELVFLKS